MLHQVEFVKGGTVAVDGRMLSYRQGEQAGFDPAIARRLIEAGFAQRIRETLPLVAAAQTLPDPQITKLASALAAIAPRLAELEGRAEVLRAQVTDLENVRAKASLLGTAFEMSGLQQARAAVADVENEREGIEAQEQPLHEELQAAVSAFVEREYKAVLADKVAPILRTIADHVRKAKPLFDGMRSVRQTIEDLRTLAQLASMDRDRLDTLETAVMGQVAGSISVGVSGASRVPQDFATLIGAIALFQISGDRRDM